MLFKKISSTRLDIMIWQRSKLNANSCSFQRKNRKFSTDFCANFMPF